MKKILILLYILATMIACDRNAEEKSDAHEEGHEEHSDSLVTLTAAQYENAGIVTGATSIRNLSEVITANGNIDIPPQNLVSISAPMGGFVRKTDLLQGMHVKKGQVLAIIENPDFIQMQQDYLETKSKLEYAELEYKRQSGLSRENINAQKIVQQAESEMKVQKARLAGLRQRILTAGIGLSTLENGTIVNNTSIFSPITGSVTTVNVNLGKYVNPTDVMFEIVDTHHLHVELSIFEQDIPKIRLGQRVRFTVTNDPDREFLAEVYLINQKINEDRTVRVHCHLVKDDPGLLPDNFVKAHIETGAIPVTALPDQAVVQFDGKSYVFVQNNEQPSGSGPYSFEMKEVARGTSENGFSQVKFAAGYDPAGAKIVIKGAYALLSKLKNSEGDDHH